MVSSGAPSLTASTLEARIEGIHACIRRHFDRVERIAIALYDPSGERLTTFVHSTDGGSPLTHYEAPLDDVPSLAEMARTGADRVIQDFSVFKDSPHEHTRRLLARGYRSSYTLPLRDDERLWGFMFFDSCEPGYFGPTVRERLAVFGQIVTPMMTQSLAAGRMLLAALRVAARLTHYRDPETGAHLERMARYARLIAQGLAAREGLSDEYVEFLYQFAPAHDIGKIAIPDSILFKDGSLSDGEFEVMKTHVTKGAEIVDGIVRELRLQLVPHVEILRNVVLSHHEAIDGSGYPQGLAGEAIPLEARIVAVADVFDALTSRRCYKRAWRNDEAFAYLDARTSTQFAEPCVAALREQEARIDAVRLLFPDADEDVYQSREGYGPEL